MADNNNNNKCLPCDLRNRRCLANCPTWVHFRDEQDYLRVLEVFSYNKMRLWMVEARDTDATARGSAALIWEAAATTSEVVMRFSWRLNKTLQFSMLKSSNSKLMLQL
ncbi:hypothetical protein TSUD_107820 [Trifolium subterraneum]|uniref:LOB domain-containing protein n=1 Tax=Trifolium subterraneum TaxID=3900 RepID=A0A2Z6M4V1_TRISU|nr:hypothetical protein TSUD_107820 [Trifolium subterraneum]